jgi:hypothetical protein
MDRGSKPRAKDDNNPRDQFASDLRRKGVAIAPNGGYP